VALVDRLDLQLALVAREVEVVLAIELLAEALGPRRVGVEIERQGAATIGP
jgi:hypothetical protein